MRKRGGEHIFRARFFQRASAFAQRRAGRENIVDEHVARSRVDFFRKFCGNGKRSAHVQPTRNRAELRLRSRVARPHEQFFDARSRDSFREFARENFALIVAAPGETFSGKRHGNERRIFKVSAKNFFFRGEHREIAERGMRRRVFHGVDDFSRGIVVDNETAGTREEKFSVAAKRTLPEFADERRARRAASRATFVFDEAQLRASLAREKTIGRISRKRSVHETMPREQQIEQRVYDAARERRRVRFEVGHRQSNADFRDFPRRGNR